jgi:hypothetical protein
MKWFKHSANASDDSFIEGLEERFGLEGYARWWKLLEVIATKMDKTDSCSAEHSWVKWQSFLKGKRNKLTLFLEHCQNESKITLEQNGNILKITCPKLLKIRDEYSKKSGHTPIPTPDKLHAKNKDIRIKNKDKEYSASKKAAPPLVLKLNPSELDEDWTAKPLPVPNVIEMWNEIIVGEHNKKSFVMLTADRKKKINQRSKDALFTGEDWYRYFTAISNDRFCMGDNDRGWKAKIDWALKPSSIVKILEGGYSG